MDNAKIHKSKLCKPLFSHLNIFYNAPYSPFLNPIEEFFSYVKNRLSQDIKKSKMTLIQEIYKKSSSVESDKIKRFWTHHLKFIIQSLNRQ